MATTPTTNYSIGKPTVGGSVDAWGTELNTALDLVDTEIKNREDEATAAQATADAALPKAGGVMTGRTDEHSATLVFNNLTGVTGAQDLDMDLGNYHRVALTGDPTFTFTNIPGVSGSVDVLIVDLTNAAGRTITWPASVTEWAEGAQPVSSNAHDVYTFISVDGGTNWQGARIMRNLS